MTVSGHLDQPARKKILKEQAYDNDDIKFEANIVSVKLFQKFSDKSAMGYAINYTLYHLINDEAIHTVELTEHNIASFSAVVRDGVKTEVYNLAAVVTINFEVTS